MDHEDARGGEELDVDEDAVNLGDDQGNGGQRIGRVRGR